MPRERDAGEGFGDFLVRTGRGRAPGRRPAHLPLELQRMSPARSRHRRRIAARAGRTQPLAGATQRRGSASRGRWPTPPANHALSSSFGAQSAVSLHLVTRQQPDIPVILIDTGYLFPETYRFIDELTSAWRSTSRSTGRRSASRGWKRASAGCGSTASTASTQLQPLRKVEPMQRALDELGVRTWIAGLRRSQSRARAGIDFLELRDGRWKLHPLADWTRPRRLAVPAAARPALPPAVGPRLRLDRRRAHHAPLQPGMREEDTRFFGLKRECGLHFDDEPGSARLKFAIRPVGAPSARCLVLLVSILRASSISDPHGRSYKP